jgi:predicted DNA-binding transcriptional regulator YafY
MPKNSNGSTMARLWQLLRLLPRRPPGATARTLHDRLAREGYAVGRRTVERDLEDLSQIFPIACNDKGRPFGWYWMPGRSLDIPGMTLPEALSLQMTEELLRPLLPAAILQVLEPQFNHAKAKLEALAEDRNPLARWKDKVRHVPPALPLQPPTIPEGVLETVQEALLHDRQVEAEYQAAHAEQASRLILHPLGLVQRGPVTYLVATAFGYRDVRLYAMHRMLSAETTDRPVRRPGHFDLDAYIAGGALQFGGGTLQLEAWVGMSLADYIEETPLSEDMQLSPEGEGQRLTATVADTWQLRWWILSQGSGIVVRKPDALRDEIRETLQEALTGYGLEP